MAKKPKLSEKQKRQLQHNRHRRLNRADEIPPDITLGELMPGRVVGRFGKHANVQEITSNRVHKCYIRRTVESVVCGDHVLFRQSQHADARSRGVIEAVEDRKTTLLRPDYYDGVKPVAANIDQIIVVSSIVPSLSTNIIDRYLVACETVGVTPIIIINKVELLDTHYRKEVLSIKSIYEHIGYRVILTSCKTNEGLSSLSDILIDQVSVFVGQSGVGKSSLINMLLPEADEAVGEISTNSGLGQHTTTASKLLRFSKGGDVIDSPGVREFGLWHIPIDEITSGFIEFRKYLGGCKFSDCKHLNDPGCLIKDAVERGDIEIERYENYHRILNSILETKPSFS